MKRLGILSVLVLLGFTTLQAQQHRERWKATDFFPEHHFVHVYSNGDIDSSFYTDRAGEVAFYMRLAGLQPWQDTSREEYLTLIRVSILPEYSHPIFISMFINDAGQCCLSFRRGNAICGYVPHSTFYKMSDTGYVDATEERYEGNVWTEGFRDEETLERWPSGEALDSLKRLLAEVDLPHHPHTNSCTGFKPPYIIEYSHDKIYNAVYDECYDKPLGTLVNYLVALADTSVLDMVIYSPNELNGIVPAQFPGGDSACRTFLAVNMHYPERALADLEEYEISPKFVVERDGSLTLISHQEDRYGFCAEAERLVSRMPRWVPAMDNGKPVRSYGRLRVRFSLPDSLQPKYGNPRLETNRDSNRWDNILTFYRRLLRQPQNQEYLFRMGIQYYDEFLLPNKPLEKPNVIDSSFIDLTGGWDNFFDRTPVIAGAADSALHYFYRALSATDSISTKNEINMYLPIRQLEQYLGLPHNPLNKMLFDTVPGVHYPYTYFFNEPDFDNLDSTVDYYLDVSLSDSYFWVEAMSNNLNTMSEPVLYNRTIDAGDTVFRCAFYPSFHPPLCFRIESTAQGRMLYWKKLDYTVDEETWETTLYPHEGQRKLSKKKYRKFMKRWNAMDFDNRARFTHRLQLDGAQWCIERRTADDFKACFTNVAGKEYDDLYSCLIRLAGIDAGYASGYCH